MDKAPRKEGLKTMAEAEVDPGHPPVAGLRRSRRLQNLPPPTTPPEEEGDGESAAAMAGERKRVRRIEGKITGAGGVSEKVQVQFEFKPCVPPSWARAAVREVSGPEVKEEVESLHDQSKSKAGRVEGRILELGEGETSVSSSSAGTMSRMTTAGGIGDRSSEEETHPCLFNEDILEVIFKLIVKECGYWMSKDVGNIRLVCKAWKGSATRVYRRNRESRQGPTISFGERKELIQFIQTMRSSEMIPVQKFWLGGEVSPMPWTMKLIQEFFRLCGPDAVYLKMYIGPENFDRGTSSIEIFKPLSDLNLPKLKTLELRMVHDPAWGMKIEVDQIHGLVHFVGQLLTAAKTLREFQLSYSASVFAKFRNQHNVNGIIEQQLGAVIARSIPKTVKDLRLDTEISDSAFNTLAEVGLGLEWFEWRGKPGNRALYKFLQSQAASLKRLRIRSNDRNHERIFADFPPLDQLENMELEESVMRIPAPADFGGTFPKLHYLEIRRVSKLDTLRAILASATKPAPSLKELDLPVWTFLESLAPLLQNVAQSFPGLTKLHVRLNTDSRATLEEVFKHFDNLEELHVILVHSRGEDWTDSIFSGISEPDCARIKRLGDFGNVDLSGLQRRPSLLNLTKLRRLDVEEGYPDGVSVRDYGTFTDFSAHFVFLEMANLNLRETRLEKPLTKFSTEYMDRMRDRVGFRY